MGLPTNYQTFIALSRYARFRDDLGRRETWEETVERYIDFLVRPNCDEKTTLEIREAIKSLEVMPSMRLLMTAGPAAKRCHVCAYNCAYIPIDDQASFSEVLYILLCGTGVGFSVEQNVVAKLPSVPERIFPTDTTIVFADSKVGWAKGFKELISLLYAGMEPKIDYSKIRPAGARLKTFGGRASGPEPLKALCEFAISKFKGAAGRGLSSIEVHDIVCKIGDVVVVGGVRRSALISLSSPSDDLMRHAKSGQFWISHGYRSLANNSAVYNEKPEVGQFMREWLALFDSKSGERGIFNRVASAKQVARTGRREPRSDWGCNPCSEIVLRPAQFCNLSEVVVRAEDTKESLKRKVRLAAILGTLQATLTDFKFLRKMWRQNCEEERLLGVSLTGIMDNLMMSGQVDPERLPEILTELKEHAVAVNKEWSAKLGINQATAVTCVKPSGTVSQLVNAASGIHTRFSHFYIRTVRADKKDPIAQFMKDSGFPVEDEKMRPDSVYVFSFPMEAPKNAIVSDSLNAIQQLEIWKTYQTYWCEHKPSVTVQVKEHEWPEVQAWVWNNFDEISGVSFLPFDGHVYEQAPYQPINEAQYRLALETMPTHIDWKALQAYETAETTTGGDRDFACVGGSCEIVDVGI